MGGNERLGASEIGRSIDIQEPQSGGQTVGMFDLAGLDKVLNREDRERFVEMSGSRPECGEAPIVA